jgi:hypothetical protein
LSSDRCDNGCFLAIAAVGDDMELKWRRFLSGSPVLPIEKKLQQQNKTPSPNNFTHISTHKFQ